MQTITHTYMRSSAPFMVLTAFLTLLSHPSQSIFTLISTVCESNKKNPKMNSALNIIYDPTPSKEQLLKWYEKEEDESSTCIAFRLPLVLVTVQKFDR